MAFQPQAAPKAKTPYRGGGSKSEFDPRPTPKDYMMAAMNAYTTALGTVTLAIQQGLAIAGGDVSAAVDKEAEALFLKIVKRGDESPRAGFQPSSTTSSTQSTPASTTSAPPAASSPSTPSAASADVPSEVTALPNASVVPPLGKYAEGKDDGPKTLAQIFVLPAKRSQGVCWMVWFAGTDQKTDRNIAFKNQVVEFLNAAEKAGMLPPDLEGVCGD